jgi:hypothetical protein
VAIEHVRTSEAYFRALNGDRKALEVGADAVAGYWKVRYPDHNRGSMRPVSIVAVRNMDEETGELLADEYFEAFVAGKQVPLSEVWPWAGRNPITAQEYETMTNLEAAQAEPQMMRVQPAQNPLVAQPDRMQSDAIDKLAEALAKAQGEVEGATKDAHNPAFKQGARVAAYATLASVWEACRRALSSNGLAVTQTTKGGDATTVTVVTTLWHSSGQWIRGELTMKPQAATPQGIGSAITYARRYALAAMVGVAPEDDDGEGAMGRQTKPEPTPMSMRTSSRDDEGMQRAAEFANDLMAQIDRMTSANFLAEYMADDKRKRALEKLERDYPDLYTQVTNVQRRKALALTKAA